MSLKQAAAPLGVKTGFLFQPTGSADTPVYEAAFRRDCSTGWITIKPGDVFPSSTVCDLSRSSYINRWDELCREEGVEAIFGYGFRGSQLDSQGLPSREPDWVRSIQTQGAFEDHIRRKADMLAEQLPNYPYLKYFGCFNEEFAAYPDAGQSIYRNGMIKDLYGEDGVADTLAWIVRTFRDALPNSVLVGFNDFSWDPSFGGSWTRKWNAMYDVVKRCGGKCEWLGDQGHIHKGILGKTDQLAIAESVELLRVEKCIRICVEADVYTAYYDIAAREMSAFFVHNHEAGVRVFNCWNATNRDDSRVNWLVGQFTDRDADGNRLPPKGNMYDQDQAGDPLGKTPMYDGLIADMKSLAGDIPDGDETMPWPEDAAIWKSQIEEKISDIETAISNLGGGATDERVDQLMVDVDNIKKNLGEAATGQ